MRQSGRYLLVGREDAARPDPVQAAWLYAQMARWGQTSLSKDALRAAMATFRPDLYDAALGKAAMPAPPDARVLSRLSPDPPSTPRISRAIWLRSTSPNALDREIGIVDSKLIP